MPPRPAALTVEAPPHLPRFYAGRHLLITGGTGFMGKVLVERILSTCPELSRIVLLLRDKRGHSAHKRLDELKRSQIFDGLRMRDPQQLDKLCVVRGDVSLPHLGLNDSDAGNTDDVLREVSIVFHAAATLKFDEPLQQALVQNVRSVQNLLELCDRLPSLEAFVYVSTAYSNAELSVVQERVYPAPHAPHLALALADAAPADLLAQITPQYISPKPNTYTFTKALAETIVEEHNTCGKYARAIFRPTVVVSSLRHPFPGWIENLNGPSGIVVGTGKGLMRVVAARENARADMLPVDIAIDTLIAVAWEIAIDRYISPKPNTYTFTKALAETIVEEHNTCGKYARAIFRPTVVVSSLRHPFPGWIENLNGPSGIVVGTGKGLMRVVAARENARADMLPVDIAIDTLIAVAWEIAIDRPQQVRVYNCSTCENPTTWKEFKRALQQYLLCHPLDNVFWCPVGYCVENKYIQKFLETVLQTVPLHIAEHIANILGIKTKLSLIKVNQRLIAMNEVLRFFSVREWYFHTDNVRRLQARLSSEDAAIFNLDPHTIVWDQLFHDFVKGTRKYLLKEKDQDIDCAKKHLQKMQFVHYGLIVFILTLVCRIILRNKYLHDFIYGTVRMLLTLLHR